MGLGANYDDNRHRMMNDDECVFRWITRWQKGFFTGGATHWDVAMVGEVVRRLRERVRTQEQQIAALEARLAALEQQVGR